MCLVGIVQCLPTTALHNSSINYFGLTFLVHLEDIYELDLHTDQTHICFSHYGSCPHYCPFQGGTVIVVFFFFFFFFFLLIFCSVSPSNAFLLTIM